MHQTNRADAAAKYLEATGFLQKAAADIQIEFEFTKAPPLEPWCRQTLNERLPRIRFLNNLGVWQLTDERGVRVLGNDIESTYLRWVESELDRNADEDLSDFPCFYNEATLLSPNWLALGWSLFGLLFIFAMAAIWCVVKR